MTRLFTAGLALAAGLAVLQPAFARGPSGGGGGRSYGGGRAVAPGGSMAMGGRGPVAAHSFAGSGGFGTQAFASPRAGSFSGSGSFGRGGHYYSPSVGFGGHREFGAVRSPRSFGGHGHAPFELSRNWDHRHDHFFDHHRYRFFNGDWVTFDGGYGYPYAYGYPYSDGYDDSPAYPAYAPDQYDSGPAPDTYVGRQADGDELAMDVQRALSRAGYSPGEADGVLGPQTRDAISEYQRDHGLPETGQIDRKLLEAMRLN